MMESDKKNYGFVNGYIKDIKTEFAHKDWERNEHATCCKGEIQTISLDI